MAETKASTTRAMTRSLEDPTFAGRVESVDADLGYSDRLRRDGSSADLSGHQVFEYPDRVRRTDARLAFPAYTGLETKIVEDIRHVTAVEGTDLDPDASRLNKDVASRPG